MNTLMSAVEDYLTLRRRLGFALERAGRLLPDFVQYVERAGSSHVTTELAMGWATLPSEAHPAWWRERLGIVRGFARYLVAIDPATEVPPVRILPARRPRIRPYVYSPDEITRLIRAAGQLRPAWRAITYETLIGLIAVTGVRLGEALDLDRSDIDLDRGLLVIGRGKLEQPRRLPLHDTTIAALRRYVDVRDRRWPQPSTPSFFVSARGARLGSGTVHENFRALATDVGLEGRGTRRWPRPHDLRH
jgi:integrase/recombinase XerD